MKANLFVLAALAGILLLLSCSIYAPRGSDDNLYVPFTSYLKERIENNKLDIKKVQFFVDQELILRRSLGTEKGDIKSGVILFENGQYIHEVIVPKYTPGVCEEVLGNRLMISFELGNNNIEFGINYDNFTIAGRNWSNGTADITFDRNIYRIRCGGTCSDASNAKLVVRKSEADKLEKTQRIVEGRKVGN